MQHTLVLLAALATVAVALGYIFKKDSQQPEPTRWLVKAFGLGLLSALLSFVFSTPMSLLLGLEVDPSTYTSVREAFLDAFFLAALPEELAKLIMLWILLRSNPSFDEKFDGIVYAVFIGMGFAGLENVLYLFDGLADGSWVSTGVVRALFAVPAHFLFAVLMGYYYSRYHFGIDQGIKGAVRVLAAPVLAHGIYDGLLFSTQVDEYLSLLCIILFLWFFHQLKKRGQEKIQHLVNQ